MTSTRAIAMAVGLTLIGLCTASLQPRALSAQLPPSVWDGLYTEDQARRGEKVYSQTCASCHGAELTGGEAQPALADGQFRANWDGLTVGDLFERIRITMPQNKSGTLTRQECADVLAFLFLRNQFPAGQNELSTRTDILKQFAFKAARP